MPELARLDGSASVDDIIAVLERDGGVIIDGFLTPETLEGLRADLLPQLEARSTGRDPFSGDKTRRLSALFKHTRHCAGIVTDPRFLETARHFISKPFVVWSGERERLMKSDLRIGVTQAIQIGPGQGAQPLHRDDHTFLWRHPTNGREARLQIMIALSDFTEENGGTLVIPGSQEWGEERMPLRSEAVPTVMKAGSILMWLGSVFHAGGQNRTADQLRTGITIAIDAANVRQEENMYLAIPPEVVASYGEDVQRLLGWASGSSSYMGFVEVDGQMIDPIHLLKPALPDNVVAGYSAPT